MASAVGGEHAAAAIVIRPPTHLDGDRAADLLATMWRIRCFEERVAQLKRSLQVHGLIHLSIGGEGVAAGVCRQLRASDAVYSSHRGHGHAIAKGAPLDRMMAELMGRDSGLCRGLGGSMHLVDVPHGFLGATGVVGGSLPLALGTALAAKTRGSDDVTAVFFGDGAVQAGHFNESVNLAALWQLPLVFVCENNGFAEFTPRSAHTVVARVSDVVAPYAFDCQTVHGSDAIAVWDAFGSFLARARAGEGPFLLECLTHRRRGHYEGDSQEYRDALADEEWLRQDPIAQFEPRALEHEWLKASAVDAIREEAAAAVEAAVAYARQSSWPDPAIAAELVYA